MQLDPGKFIDALRWLDERPLADYVEPYRRRLFERFFLDVDASGRLAHNLGLFGRAKKNWKTADLVLACYLALLSDSPGGNQVYIVANDENQAGDDLALAKKLRAVNPLLKDHTRAPKRNVIERADGEGFIEILPAQDAIGAHGKTYRLLAIDEIHGYRSYDLLEALAPDPTRGDAQIWITSYASMFHRPGVPLFDLVRTGRAGTDARMLFSWYAADFTTDPDFGAASPEQRANPSMPSWRDGGAYLDQQRLRLPAHKYRRLHLNLPGLPEGSAFQPEPVMDAFARGVAHRPPEPDVAYCAFVDMSGGSSDDAVLAIGHTCDGVVLVDRVLDQGGRPPFDPRAAVDRFVRTLREYRVTHVTGDRYAGETFRFDFGRAGIGYTVASESKSELYEALEPVLNAHGVSLPDVAQLEQQLLGLVWRGGRIDHQAGEHDDYANAVAGVVREANAGSYFGTEDDRLRLLSAGGKDDKTPVDEDDDEPEIDEPFDRYRNRDFERF